MNNIITIAGKLGSGKSSVSKQIAKSLKLNHFSSGDFMRNIAQQRGLSISELLVQAESEPQIDYDVDQLLEKKGSENNLIIDSRLAYHFIPHSFKVYLDIDSEIAAQRMFSDLQNNDSRRQTEHAHDINEMKENMIERHNCDKKRYAHLYGIDHSDHSNFDLVINTGLPENNLETVVKMIIDKYHKHKNNL